MTFKELLEQEAKRIFLNFDEFGEKHLVDGKEMLVIVDNNEHIERENRQTSRAEGLYIKEILFYVCKEDFGSLPAIGRICRFDRKDYIVADAINEDGIYSITLEANRS